MCMCVCYLGNVEQYFVLLLDESSNGKSPFDKNLGQFLKTSLLQRNGHV